MFVCPATLDLSAHRLCHHYSVVLSLWSLACEWQQNAQQTRNTWKVPGPAPGIFSPTPRTIGLRCGVALLKDCPGSRMGAPCCRPLGAAPAPFLAGV